MCKVVKKCDADKQWTATQYLQLGWGTWCWVSGRRGVVCLTPWPLNNKAMGNSNLADLSSCEFRQVTTPWHDSTLYRDNIDLAAVGNTWLYSLAGIQWWFWETHYVGFLLNNQTDAIIIQILFCYKTLHVSGIFSAHHQEFSTVQSALVSFMQVSDDRFHAESGWNCVPSWLCLDTVINLPVPNVQ